VGFSGGGCKNETNLASCILWIPKPLDFSDGSGILFDAAGENDGKLAG
jgi:hypothetical protein